MKAKLLLAVVVLLISAAPVLAHHAFAAEFDRTKPFKASGTGALTMKYELTIDDPKIFTRPFTNTWEMSMVPEWELEEFICEDNNDNNKDVELIKFLEKEKEAAKD